MLLFIQLNFQQFVLFQMIYERWANKSRTVLTASTDHCVDFNKMEGVTLHKRLACIMIVAFTFRRYYSLLTLVSSHDATSVSDTLQSLNYIVGVGYT